MSVGYRLLEALGGSTISPYIWDTGLYIYEPPRPATSQLENNPHDWLKSQQSKNHIYLYPNPTMPLETTHASGHLDLFGKCFHEEYDSELEDIPRDNEPLKHTIIEYLISENLEVWEEFLNNKFCRAGYTNSDSKFDDKWRYYAKVIISNPAVLFLPPAPHG